MCSCACAFVYVRGAFHFRNPVKIRKVILLKSGNPQEIPRILKSCKYSICSNLLQFIGSSSKDLLKSIKKSHKLRQTPEHLKGRVAMLRPLRCFFLLP